ncbi:MAG: DUF1616 domain-containing protein [Anaerolineae bacterium]|nr:DUF1616 domain-containing protein [Anaerolineae bacterium]
MKIRNEFSIIAALGVVLLALIATEVQGVPALLPMVRLALGLTFVLFVPGYALQATVFPRDGELDGPERWALSFGLSIAVIPPLALILDRLPWGIRLWPIVIGEGLLIAVFSVAALWRRKRLPPEARYGINVKINPKGWWGAQDRINRVLYGVLAGTLVMAIISTSAIVIRPKPGDFFTEFYILGEEGLAELYPREAAPGEMLSVTMGLHNLERNAHTYRVEIWAVDIWENRQVQVGAAGPFELAREQRVEQPVTWAMPWTGQDQQVEFRLFSDIQKDATDQPYRLLRLWLNVNKH